MVFPPLRWRITRQIHHLTNKACGSGVYTVERRSADDKFEDLSHT
jgi:hypothetical protein